MTMHLRPSHLKVLNRLVVDEAGQQLLIKAMLATPDLFGDTANMHLAFRRQGQWWTMDQSGHQQVFFDQKLLQAMYEQATGDLLEQARQGVLDMLQVTDEPAVQIDWDSFRFGPKPEEPAPAYAPSTPALNPKPAILPHLKPPKPTWA